MTFVPAAVTAATLTASFVPAFAAVWYAVRMSVTDALIVVGAAASILTH